VRIDNVSPAFEFTASGAFNTPVGSAMPAPIGPGQAYEITFSAAPGALLSFVTMFVPSNDFFFAPDGNGIALFDANGTPISGDVTAQVLLWDAGTEVNQEPGIGPDQVQRQIAPNTGASDPDNTARLAPDTFGNLPPVDTVIRVTITALSDTSFRLQIENVSDNTALTSSDGTMQAVPLSPGVWVVHSAPDPLFTVGQPDRGEGLEGIAEDGDPAPLAAVLEGQANIIFSAIFNTPVGATTPSPIGPGGAYEITFSAMPDERLSFATMFVPSNDFFFAPDGDGIALFDANDMPISGNVTAQVPLWDTGTEVNQEPGTGLDQVQRQAAPNTGAPDPDNTVRLAPDTFNNLPPNDTIVRITITPQD
jgi:hypothetical protein